MKRTLQILDKVSESLYSRKTYYQFNKQDENLSQKYRKGRINAANWLNELYYVFVEKENNFLNEYLQHIQDEKKRISNLKDSDFKQAVFDELNLVEEELLKQLRN